MQLGENDHSGVGSSGARSPPDWGFLAAEPPHAQPKRRGSRAIEKQKSPCMQMSKFSPSSHPCGMQDESCPNGAHSCYFGGLCRCVPGHPGRENHTQPRLLLWQLVCRWRKGGQHLEKGGQTGPRACACHTGPGDTGRRTGGCQCSSWDKADIREAQQDRQLLFIYQGDKLGKEVMLEDSTFYPLCLAGFSLVPGQNFPVPRGRVWVSKTRS